MAAVLSADAVESARVVIRLTARTSLVLFLLAFTASSISRLWPSTFAAWLTANRRYLGLAFVVSHGIHAVAIIALARLDPSLFDELTTIVSFVAGGIGYAIIALMALTSFDRTAAMVGPRLWRVAHTGGVWFIVAFFIVNFGRRAVIHPETYWPYMALIVLAIVVRLAAIPRKQTVPA